MYLRFGKRICDLAVGIVALPFVLIIIAVLAPIIHFEDKGPVFYNAPRVGKETRLAYAVIDAARERPRLELWRTARPTTEPTTRA